MEAVVELTKTFIGPVLVPGAPSYDEVRRIHNGMIDRRPAVIARCRGIADIADAVRFARAQGLEITVRGGGHNVGGRAVVDGAMMIDLSLMKGIHVNAKDRTAVVEGGALWKEFNRETQLHGLAVTGGVIGTTGVAGLTLGGGLGWLMPKYGMALDNLIAVNLVLADGSVVRASADEHPDLFWAVRGGGGNFGVAASFEFRLHQVGPIVIGGLVAFPFPEARKVLRAYRDLAATAPDELMLVCGADHSAGRIGHQDRRGRRMPLRDAAEDGEAVAAKIKTFGTVAVDAMGPIPYAALNGMLDGGFPAGAHNYWKSVFHAAARRRGDRRPGRCLRTMSGADQRAPARELPRRGVARPGRRHGLRAPRQRLQHAHRWAVDGSAAGEARRWPGSARPSPHLSRSPGRAAT